jgi:hypothetical protein
VPTHADGYLIPFTGAEVTAMEIETIGVRDMSHVIESRRVDENVMTRTFLVKWSERFNFIEHVIGDSKLWTDAGTTKLSRLLPDSTFGRHPESTQIMATRIDEIRAHDVGADNLAQFPQSTKARITVFYEQVPFQIKSDAAATSERDRFTSRGQSSMDLEAITVPGAAFKYVSAAGAGGPGGGAPVPVPFNLSFMRPVHRFEMIWHNLPNDLYQTGGALYRRLFIGTGDSIPWLGTVNEESISFTAIGNYEPGQLLLEGVIDRQFKSPLVSTGLSGMKWDIGFKFAYTPRTWMKLFFWDAANPANSDYYLVTNDATNYAINAVPDKTGLFNMRDFNDLFNPHLA